MSQPKTIASITVDDLKAHRWCYYHNDEEGYDCFEHAIPDTHPDYSSDVEEIELAEFEFQNGDTRFGVFDGSESFCIILEGRWQSFWFGVAKPSESDLKELSDYLHSSGLELPVKVKAKWSGKEAIFNGLKYINNNDEICEVII